MGGVIILEIPLSVDDSLDASLLLQSLIALPLSIYPFIYLFIFVVIVIFGGGGAGW